MSTAPGPSTASATTSNEQTQNTVQQPKLELAGKVEVYKSSWLENLLDYSILVSNNISMARDQLANERNWLTWFRLSCTLIILGFTVLIQFRLPDNGDDHDNNNNSNSGDSGSHFADVANKPVGFIFIIIGFLCFLVGIGKYFKNQRLLVKQATYVEAGWGSYSMVLIVFIFVCTIMILASTNKTANSFISSYLI
ncbi:hypothetical protein BDF20DRAFT_911019 [Mycotypha africana]|uniref:uncharacterized protein n=1 Tax=Mycotypha africana TaxID=64632 RepID=UPI0023000DCC|nr:uncharacterized protein BDF20DRAFT_911019 [Mycotypha africana]KAI8988561.1 hypothetical protein BDF20DRAFT_911019 [Mycotypha africana]